MTTRSVGTRILRKEDPLLLTGRGRYVDDMNPRGVLHAAFVRSPVAHARVTGIDVEQAREIPGVHAVLTPDELPPQIRDRRLPLHVPNPSIAYPVTQTPLAADEVCFVGGPVAMVL
ncbi:MAG: xanthine dehydrogenase family protein molybdopterin-binding subunit, partial [Actinophytocola sp.]|nr:xanthine dehydrogenase family protein molybdopterin-binding subunit [Actinophytocola sp.]